MVLSLPLSDCLRRRWPTFGWSRRGLAHSRCKVTTGSSCCQCYFLHFTLACFPPRFRPTNILPKDRNRKGATCCRLRPYPKKILYEFGLCLCRCFCLSCGLLCRCLFGCFSSGGLCLSGSLSCCYLGLLLCHLFGLCLVLLSLFL